MEFRALLIPFNEHAQFTHDYTITDAEKQAVVQSLRNPALNIIRQLVPVPSQGQALREVMDGFRNLVDLALAVTPKLSVYYVVQGSCANLAAAKIRIVPSPEVQGPTGAFSAAISNFGFAIKYSHSLEHAELETTFIECQNDDEEGMKKGVRFLYKLRLKFEVTVGPLTLSPSISKDDTQLVITPCCEDYEPEDFEDVDFSKAPKERRGKAEQGIATKRKEGKTVGRKAN